MTPRSHFSLLWCMYSQKRGEEIRQMAMQESWHPENECDLPFDKRELIKQYMQEMQKQPSESIGALL